MDPLGELITRIQRHAAINGPRTRAQSSAAAPEAAAVSPQASDSTAAAVRALLAEGASGRALQLLTSDGVYDAADPTVLARLRELHPQVEGPNLEPPLPEDRPDVAPSWASDQLLPIAVGDILRRLVAKWLLATAQGRNAPAALAPLQTACAKGSPCEVVAMGVQAQVDALHGSTWWLLLQVGLKNAFN